MGLPYFGDTMITVHDLNNSRSRRIIWLLEELDLEYRIAYHQRDAGLRSPTSLKRIHALGKAPVLQDDEITLAESGAIVDYLLRRYGNGRLQPSVEAPQLQASFLQWLHYAEGSAIQPLLMNLFLQLFQLTDQPIGDFFQKELDLHLTYINDHLSQQPYFVGEDFTAADIMMSYVIESADGQGTPVPGLPSLLKNHQATQAYLHRLQERPAYKTMIAKLALPA